MGKKKKEYMVIFEGSVVILAQDRDEAREIVSRDIDQILNNVQLKVEEK